MIVVTSYAMVALQTLSKLLTILSRDAVDYTTLAFEASLKHDLDVVS